MKTKSLAFIAGIIWLIAGFNVCRIGVVSWTHIDNTSVLMIMGCMVTMFLFSNMFVKMLFKNVRRIRDIDADKRKVWHIMPVKSYSTLAFIPHISLVQHPSQILTHIEVPETTMRVEKICVMKSERINGELIYSEI